jgi:F-type H+-transporting ATPase subunit delta
VRNNLVAQRYAKAVLRNVEQRDHHALRKDVFTLRDLFAEDREFISALNSFLYPLNERLDLALKITYGLQNPEIWQNLFSILIKKHRFNILTDILNTLDHDILAESDKIKVELILAFQHDENMVKRIIKKVEKALHSEVEVNIVIDPGIIGGFIAKTETMKIDGSIQNNLVRLVETSSKYNK